MRAEAAELVELAELAVEGRFNRKASCSDKLPRPWGANRTIRG